jgi:hypothetical protein
LQSGEASHTPTATAAAAAAVAAAAGRVLQNALEPGLAMALLLHGLLS